MKVEKIYPSPNELSAVDNHLKCSEPDCSQVFTSSSNLLMHVTKHHKRQILEKSHSDAVLEYYCPAEHCPYSLYKHFKKLSYLKQHYLKVHADKSFLCHCCCKGFATAKVRDVHENFCNVTFACAQCSNKYSSYESLLTHSRRNKHIIPPKGFFSKNPIPEAEKPRESRAKPGKQRLILPMPCSTVHLLIPVQRTMSDMQTQTEPANRRAARGKISRKRISQQTQTHANRGPRSSIETQTIADCTLRKILKDVCEDKDDCRISIETQTKTLADPCISGSILDTWSTSTHTSTQTQDKMELFPSLLEDALNCDTQTQTEGMLDDEDLDLYANMCTQTCDADALFSELGFNDTQTQTTWPDYDILVSAETQTSRYHYPASLSVALNCRETTHMETQTDTGFKFMLEEINA